MIGDFRRFVIQSYSVVFATHVSAWFVCAVLFVWKYSFILSISCDFVFVKTERTFATCIYSCISEREKSYATPTRRYLPRATVTQVPNRTKELLCQLITSHDRDTRTTFRPRGVPSRSSSSSLLARQTRHLVRSSGITIRVGSHHVPAHQIQLRRFATESTTSFRGGRYHHCTTRTRTI